MANSLQLSWKLRSRLRMFAIAILLGALVGIFVLYPTNEFVYFYEYQPTPDTRPVDFAVHQMQRSLQGQTPKKTIFYAIVGVILSVGGAALYSSMQRRSARIEQLSAALDSDLHTLIAQGESADLEFKSSFRWDLRENKVNRALEGVILKTLAGYMNGQGGTLLIGVADDGNVVGLEHGLQDAEEAGPRRLRAGVDDGGGDQAGRGRLPLGADRVSFASRQGCLPRDDLRPCSARCT